MDIRNVKDIGGLLDYLQEYVGWNISETGCEDIADYMYEYTPDELGLKPAECAKIRSLKQLPSLDEKQKWGIFAVDFATAKLSVTALRKILAHLIPTRRNAADHKVWNAEDMLFFCFWGSGAERTICVASFLEQKNAPAQIRCFYCAPNQAGPLEKVKFEHNLRKLQWTVSADWHKAFDTFYGEVIKTSAELAQRLAEVATEIKRRILDALEVESERGFVHRQCDKVRRDLIQQLSYEEFADMYAQTIVYGLFSARCMDESLNDFSANEAIDLIPNTNPFLKGLMRDCFQKRADGKLGFDELGIGDVVNLLSRVKNAKVIAAHFDFMTGGGKEDPVIHFYEEFLAAYDKKQKVERGVFYTPKSVVGFTVRAVDYLLKSVFGISDGLACDEKIDVPVKPKSKKTKKVHRIQLLDPATGTGTYVMETILQIYENFKNKHKGLSKEAFHDEWNEYVDAHVLPRLYAFELMMAPYAVAHMKLAMVLKDTGYDFKDGERLKVYLTNTLEEPGDTDRQMLLDGFGKDDPLAAESAAANEAKKNDNINIVIGNPPYSGISQNNGEWITKLVDEYKYTNGVYFNERKHWLNDDYVKFIRYGQERIHQAGWGILAYINPHGFIDNVTFRAMRWNLLKEFDEIYILNLHGNAKKHETCPDGNKDENVFDIEQGVSINLFVKYDKTSSRSGARADNGKKIASVRYADLFGLRGKKYDYLLQTAFSEVNWQELAPTDPYYFFAPKDFSAAGEYETGFKLEEFMPLNSTGVLTMGDSFAVSQDKKCLKDRIRKFLAGNVTSEKLTEDFSLGKNYAQFVLEGKSAIEFNATSLRKYNYRPFDENWIYYDSKVIWRHRDKVMRHVSDDSLSLVVCKQMATNEWSLVLSALGLVDDCYVSNKTKERGYVFPLYLYDTAVEPPSCRVNFDAAIYKKICKAAGLKFSGQDLQATACKHGTQSSACKCRSENGNPQLVFDYIYAVLHSGKYRKKYAEFLKIDFPRIPYPKNGEEFRTMAAFGAELRRIHCMEDFDEAAEVELVGGDGAPGGRALPVKPTVVKPVWKDGGVYIDKEVKFTNVAEDLWNFYIGGYQPLQKWLKDRKGRELSAEDVSHYKRMVRAIARTRDIMAKIEGCYELTACSCED